MTCRRKGMECFVHKIIMMRAAKRKGPIRKKNECANFSAYREKNNYSTGNFDAQDYNSKKTKQNKTR